MRMLPLRDDRAWPPLLAHAVEGMQRPHSVAQRMAIRNRGRDIHFGEKNRLGQSAPMCEVAGQRRGECTSGAMRGIRALTVRLENFLFGASGSRETEKIARLLQVASRDYHIRRSQRVQASSRLAHLIEIRDGLPGQDTGLVNVRRDYLRQRNQLLDQYPGPRRIQ